MNDKKSWIILLVVLVIVVVAGFMIFSKGGVGGVVIDTTKTTKTETAGYQAVFLVNNQLYFGKLSSENSQFPVL